MSYPDVMVDIETTGTRPDRHAIIQLAAVKFNLKDRTVGPSFNLSLQMPPNRYWEESTRDWWLRDKAELLERIVTRAMAPGLVMQAFAEWASKDHDWSNSLVFWAKPISFDYAFISSYFNDFDVANPFHYRAANDMNSFIRARFYPEEVPDMKLEVPMIGETHDAINDVFHQIAVLFHAMEMRP